MFEKESYKKNDPIYFRTTEYESPKEYFKIIVRRIQELSEKKSIKLIDVACAAGGFLYFANQQLNIKKGVGIDISDKLIEQARLFIPEFEFYTHSVISSSTSQDNPVVKLKNEFDVCTFLGSFGIFDEIDIVLSNLLSYLKEDGSLFIFGSFNDDPVDMLMRYKRVDDQVKESDWQVGFNIRSKKTIEKVINQINPNCEIVWEDFTLPFSISKTENPMRSWTVKTEFNKNQIVVGTGQILYHKILHIKRKKLK